MVKSIFTYVGKKGCNQSPINGLFHITMTDSEQEQEQVFREGSRAAEMQARNPSGAVSNLSKR